LLKKYDTVQIQLDGIAVKGGSMADPNDRDLMSRGIENSAEGQAKDAKGKVKDAVGGLTGDTSLQAEGKVDQAKGKVQDAVGKVQRDLDPDQH